MQAATVTPKKHARLSPSGAHRWMACPASVRMEAGYPDQSSVFAREGTAAHELADWCLREQKDADYYIGKDIDVESDVFTVDHEMADNVQIYLDYVRNEAKGGHLFPEQRVSYSDWVPDGSGTSDSVVIKDGLIMIADLKYGKGVRVDAEHNEQLMLYALGAYAAYEWLYDLHHVKVAVVQPRLDHISEWSLSVDELLKFGEEARTKAQLALGGNGGFNPGGKACQWCKAKGDCKALTAHNLDIIKGEFTDLTSQIDADVPDTSSIDTLAPEQLAALLGQVDGIKAWIAAIEASAQSKLERGDDVPGYKLVEGRSVRKWADEEAAEEALRKARVKVSDMMQPQKLKTPTQMEKVLGKKHPVLIEFVVKPDGKPTIAPVSDKRPALNLNPTDGFEAVI